MYLNQNLNTPCFVQNKTRNRRTRTLLVRIWMIVAWEGVKVETCGNRFWEKSKVDLTPRWFFCLEERYDDKAQRFWEGSGVSWVIPYVYIYVHTLVGSFNQSKLQQKFLSKSSILNIYKYPPNKPGNQKPLKDLEILYKHLPFWSHLENPRAAIYQLILFGNLIGGSIWGVPKMVGETPQTGPWNRFPT